MVGRKRAETLMFFIGHANKIAFVVLSGLILPGRATDTGLIEDGEAGGDIAVSRRSSRGAHEATNVLSSAFGHVF